MSVETDAPSTSMKFLVFLAGDRRQVTVLGFDVFVASKLDDPTKTAATQALHRRGTAPAHHRQPFLGLHFEFLVHGFANWEKSSDGPSLSCSCCWTDVVESLSAYSMGNGTGVKTLWIFFPFSSVMKGSCSTRAVVMDGR
jgi:hypothetical protein